ncbi:MAG: VOC family protein [Defluviitaleaceae bacterium]|nr:VOC family protein [Defluviitaleaceae bacterium]
MLVPIISFQGNCDEAISFYKEAVNASVKTINYLSEAPEGFAIEGASPNFVMHSELMIYGTPITMTDGATSKITGEYFSLSIAFNSSEEATSVFNKLADGGQVIEALAPQFWSPLCGDVKDRFGIHWHIYTI